MGSSTTWTRRENKLFEDALAVYDKDTADKWEKITRAVGGSKTVEDIKIHYQKLVDDIEAIEAGKVPIPDYEGYEEYKRKQKKIMKERKQKNLK